jgi:hypothetical protein
MQNLAHSASFESLDKDAPSKAETKQLGHSVKSCVRAQVYARQRFHDLILAARLRNFFRAAASQPVAIDELSDCRIYFRASGALVEPPNLRLPKHADSDVPVSFLAPTKSKTGQNTGQPQKGSAAANHADEPTRVVKPADGPLWRSRKNGRISFYLNIISDISPKGNLFS